METDFERRMARHDDHKRRQQLAHREFRTEHRKAGK